MSTYHDDAEQLLGYETEHHEAPVPLEPIPVCLDEPVVTVATVPQHSSFRTVVLTTDNPFAQLLPPDPLRVSASVYSPDHDVVLSSSAAQAADKANTTDTALARPNGALLVAGRWAPMPINTTDAVWASGPTYTSRVVAVITRRTT